MSGRHRKPKTSAVTVAKLDTTPRPAAINYPPCSHAGPGDGPDEDDG